MKFFSFHIKAKLIPHLQIQSGAKLFLAALANIFWDHFSVATFFTFVGIKQCLVLLKHFPYATFHTFKHN